MLSLTFAILIGRYVSPLPFFDFIEGILYGVSIALNFVYLIRLNKTDKNECFNLDETEDENTR